LGSAQQRRPAVGTGTGVGAGEKISKFTPNRLFRSRIPCPNAMLEAPGDRAEPVRSLAIAALLSHHGRHERKEVVLLA
jgi:hypothetical protein